jgi:hypothetical protein
MMKREGHIARMGETRNTYKLLARKDSLSHCGVSSIKNDVKTSHLRLLFTQK